MNIQLFTRLAGGRLAEIIGWQASQDRFGDFEINLTIRAHLRVPAWVVRWRARAALERRDGGTPLSALPLAAATWQRGHDGHDIWQLDYRKEAPRWTWAQTGW